MPGTWKAPLNAPTFNVGTMLLLTDGCVLAQDSDTTHWWKLKPDNAGRYVSGAWTQISNSNHAPLRFASAVLRDGKLFVAGGDTNNGQPPIQFTAELYDPVTDRWSNLPTPNGWNTIGNAPCCVLPDGKVLLGSAVNNHCVIFDPETLGWTATGNKQNNNSRGETWTLLPDGTVVSVDCDGAAAASERYVDGTWIANGATAPNLVDPASHEIGPAILLADLTVLAFGGGMATSLFTLPQNRTQAGTWAQGPTFQQPEGGQLSARNAPACLLPNGRVLCAAAPVGGAANAPGPATVFFEFDPANDAITPLAQQPANANSTASAGRLLLLPNGTVLFSNGTSDLRVYEPDGDARPASQPHISDWPVQIEAGTDATLQGTQFNGMSQACSIGGNGGVATNYPQVRLQSVATDGQVLYCRTFNHSGMGVATGAAVQSTRFAVPSDAPLGQYQLCVIANGVASATHPISIAARNGRSPLDLTQEEQDLQHELFWRDLNEVHLLMDFVSGRSDKSLADLKDVADPVDPSKKMDPQKVVEAVCQIRFPPTGSAVSRAQQAALLLSAKDRLNALSAPARGLSIAYTAMFAGVALPPSPDEQSWFVRLLRYCGWAAPNAVAAADPQRPSSAFATAAYPNLTHSARRFRSWFPVLPWIAIVWAIVTALVYWDVALSTHVLAQLTQLQQQARQAPNPTPSANQAPATNAAVSTTPRAAQSAMAPSINMASCDVVTLQDHELKHACEDLSALTERHLWKHPVGWVMYWLREKNGMSGSVDKPREQLAASVIDLFTNYIVPMVFGLLGTLAGVVRSIWNKARDSILSPRDERLAVATVPLGLVAGLAVGLVISPSSSGSITLSATALAFLAGYGADAFFSMVDDLLKRVFSLGGSGTSK